MRTASRWLVPLAVVGTVLGGVAVGSAQADSAPSLPDRTPQQVLASVAGAKVTALSGTVVTRTELGLPAVQLPGGPGGHGGLSASDPQGLVTRFLTGENTLRVWADGPSRQRVQLIDPFDELNVVRNGSQVWTYSARRNEVGKGTAPAGDTHRDGSKAMPSGPADLTPSQLAGRVLAAVDPTTRVSLARPQLVAGRAAYALTLTPRTDATLVDRVVVAVDAEKGVPLQVEVFARGHDNPAIETGFTAVNFDRPAASAFSFTPPKGATVIPLPRAGDGGAGTAPPKAPARPEGRSGSGATRGDAGARPAVTGTGWASIVELPAPGAAGSPSSPGSPDLIDQLTKPVDGGRAFSSRLLSVLVTDDGRVLVGAVPVRALVDAAR